ncbi:hypothetical protein E2C01_010895 [Portunus trituberculatus]|uniref:Uncharacterized protein n=1 Tax=Portunus trituberculatus TaxID=210409 RepID=A0A5B7D9L4_PORTR|nr:hypothetical protein [Portunus trituberculatus]
MKINHRERMKKLNERREEEGKDLSRSAQRHPPPPTYDLTRSHTCPLHTTSACSLNLTAVSFTAFTVTSNK